MLDLKEMKEFIETQTTMDGRIAPDYTASFELKRIIDQLLEVAEQEQACYEAQVR